MLIRAYPSYLFTKLFKLASTNSISIQVYIEYQRYQPDVYDFEENKIYFPVLSNFYSHSPQPLFDVKEN